MKANARPRDYWDKHVAPSNLPGGEAFSAARWPAEIAFYLTPEQDFAYRAMKPLESRRVIEIGCGVGVNAINLGRERAKVAALDASLERLRILRRVAEEMGLAATVLPVCASAEHLPFRDCSFDAAYTKSSLIHTDLAVAARECRRILRTGGRGVFCEPTTLNPFAWCYRRFFGPAQWRSITRYFSRTEERLLAGTFGNLSFESFYLTAFLAFYWQFVRRDLKRFRRWLALLRAVDRALFALCPPLKRLAWFRVYVVENQSRGDGQS